MVDKIDNVYRPEFVTAEFADVVEPVKAVEEKPEPTPELEVKVTTVKGHPTLVGNEYMGEDGRYHIPVVYRGIKFDFIPSRLKNNGVFYCIGKLTDERSGDAVLKWQSRLFDLLFGEDQAFDLLEALSYDDNGVEDPQQIIDFMQFLLTEVADAKN